MSELAFRHPLPPSLTPSLPNVLFGSLVFPVTLGKAKQSSEGASFELLGFSMHCCELSMKSEVHEDFCLCCVFFFSNKKSTFLFQKALSVLWKVQVVFVSHLLQPVHWWLNGFWGLSAKPFFLKVASFSSQTVIWNRCWLCPVSLFAWRNRLPLSERCYFFVSC